MEVSNTREKPPARFNRLYCDYYEKNILPKMLNKTKFGFAKDLEELINKWDRIGVLDALMDVAGCFICLDEKVHAGKFMNLLLFYICISYKNFFYSKMLLRFLYSVKRYRLWVGILLQSLKPWIWQLF